MDLDLWDCFGREEKNSGKTSTKAILSFQNNLRDEIFLRSTLSFQYNPEDVDPSYKMDLDLLDCFDRSRSLGLLWKDKMDLDLWNCFTQRLTSIKTIP